MKHPAEGTASVLSALRTVLVVLAAARRRIAMADHGCAEGVGSRNGGYPAGRNRRKNLHREGEQDYGQKVL